MILRRKIIVTALVGFLVGAGIGVGLAYVKRQERAAEPPPTVEESLTLRCSGGTSPRILITWPEKLTPLMAGLQRSTDDTQIWNPVFTVGQQPKPSGYLDNAVINDITYHYRVVILEDTTTLTESIRTDVSACANQ